MNVTQALEQRRSIRHYDPGHELTETELRRLMTAAALSPTSFNIQNRHIVAVRDQEVKQRLQAAAFDQEHIRDASVVLVLTGDLTAHRRPERFMHAADDALRAQMESLITGFYGDDESLIRDEACRSVGLASMSLMLTAKEMGYESCAVIGFDPARVSEILDLDETHPPLLLVVVGKGTQAAHDRLGFLDLEELVSVDSFGNHSLAGAIEA